MADAVEVEARLAETAQQPLTVTAEQLGVRIEDDILVTASGHDILSAKAPRTAEDVEKAMKPRKGNH